MMSKDKIVSYAKSQGYIDVEFLHKWRDYDVYEPVYDKKEVAYIGLPLKILVKGEEIRMTTPDEAFEHLDETE